MKSSYLICDRCGNKLTLLLYTGVCDVCEPPENIKEKEQEQLELEEEWDREEVTQPMGTYRLDRI